MTIRKNLLVLDWSNLLFRSLFMSRVFGDNNNYDSEEDVAQFVVKFATDVIYQLKTFKPNNVIIATDSQHAWRKDILPGENGYKANRKKDDNINWDNIFNGANELIKIMSENELYFASVDHCEADDICAMCKELVFEKYQDYNIIIVSADADLRQLIEFNKLSQQYCAVYNTTSRGKGGKRYFYVTQEMKDWLDTSDQIDIFFSNMDGNKQYLKDLFTNNTNMELTVEDPNNVVLSKIFCGDDGDNVPAFYEWWKDGKKMRISPGRYKKIREKCKFDNVGQLLEKYTGIKKVIDEIVKRPVEDLDVKERLDRQMSLVVLNSEYFPQEIKNYKESISYMLENIPSTNFWNLHPNTLFEGTKFEDATTKKKALQADVFKELDRFIPKNDMNVSARLF